MKFQVGQTVIGEISGLDRKHLVGVVIAQRNFDAGPAPALNLLKVRFQNSNSTTGIYLSTDYETRLLNDNSPAPHMIRLLEK